MPEILVDFDAWQTLTDCHEPCDRDWSKKPTEPCDQLPLSEEESSTDAVPASTAEDDAELGSEPSNAFTGQFQQQISDLVGAGTSLVGAGLVGLGSFLGAGYHAAAEN